MSERREQASKRERGRKKNPLVPPPPKRQECPKHGLWTRIVFEDGRTQVRACPVCSFERWRPANNAQRAAWKASGGK